jgi:hypothetical protein
MGNCPFAAPARVTALALLCPLLFVAAQTLSSQAASAPQSGAAPSGSKADDDWLEHVRSLYASTARDGLKGFDCNVHPDWRALISSANSGNVDAEGERKIAALKPVRIAMHAHMTGSAAVDWDSGNPPADMTDMMNSLRDGTKQTLDGFVQFWAPFADASVIPVNSKGIEFTPTADGGRTLRGTDNGTTVTETFGADSVLREYDVRMTGTTVLFTPTFTQTPKGLRVTYFLAHIKPDSGAEQELHVRVVYGEVGGFTIPFELYMTVAGTGTFNFTMDGCRVNP